MLKERVDEVSEYTIIEVEARRCALQFSTLPNDFTRQRESRASQEASRFGDSLQARKFPLRSAKFLTQMICGVCKVLQGKSASDVENTQIDVGVLRQRNGFTYCNPVTVMILCCSTYTKSD